MLPYTLDPALFALHRQQQACRVGFGQCCSTAGRPLRHGTVCQAPSNPCMMPATCDGRNATCPATRSLPNGTPCSLNPRVTFDNRMSEFDPRPYLYPSRTLLATSAGAGQTAAATYTTAAVQAAAATTAAVHGLEHVECHRCFKGQCRRIVVLREGKATGRNTEDGWEMVRIDRGVSSSQRAADAADTTDDDSGSEVGRVGRGLQAPRRRQQPAWMYCR